VTAAPAVSSAIVAAAAMITTAMVAAVIIATAVVGPGSAGRKRFHRGGAEQCSHGDYVASRSGNGRKGIQRFHGNDLHSQ
jgi:hypothetical protein